MGTMDIGGHGNPIEGRSTKYDWEAAFADVAACFDHDIQFDDLSSKGVQSEIINLLRSSFEGTELPTGTGLNSWAGCWFSYTGMRAREAGVLRRCGVER